MDVGDRTAPAGSVVGGMSQPAVLIVDDEEDVRNLVSYAFSRRGYRVDTSVDGAQALEAVHVAPPDLVITDVLMPRMTGLELAEQLRGDDRTKHIPILMLSARDQVEDVLAGYERGADEYITKPIELALLVAKAEALLRRSARDREGVASPGPSATVVAFARAKGGVGASTLAVATAVLAAGQGRRTCLFDLDTATHSAAEILGADARGAADHAVPDPVAGDLFDRLVVSTPPGVDVLVTGRGVGSAGGLRVDLALGALQRLRQKYELLVLDLPLTLESWMNPLVEASSRVCLVTGPQVTSLAALAGHTHALAGLPGAMGRTLVVLNHVVDSPAGPAEIARQLGRAPDVEIPNSDLLLRLGSLGWSAMADEWGELASQLGPALGAVVGSPRTASVAL